MYKDYQVVTGSSTVAAAKKVANLMADGWIPYGSPFTRLLGQQAETYIQAVVLPADSEPLLDTDDATPEEMLAAIEIVSALVDKYISNRADQRLHLINLQRLADAINDNQGGV